MKKLLTLFTLLLTVCSGAWADSVTFSGDELDKDAATKTKGQVTVVSATGTSSYQQWKDGSTKKNAQGVQVGSSADNSAPTVASGTGLQFSVPEGYVITGVSIIATTNNDTNTGQLVFLQWASAFDKTPDSFEQITVPNRGGASAPAAISPASLVSGARAFGLYKRIKVDDATTPTEIPSSNGSNWPSSATTFYVFSVTVEYEAAGVTEPTFSSATGSSLVKESGNVTITGATDNTVYYKWSQTNNAYSDGATLAADNDGYGTTTVNAAIPSTTGTWYLYAVAKDGDDYSDVVKATYTITNQTYTVTLNTNGGTINAGNVTEYVEGTGATLPTNTNVTKDCYTFAGWYDNSGLTGVAVTTISTEATGNKEYWAKWTPLYTTGTYTFENNKTVGTETSKTVTTTATAYDAFRVDNMFFSDMTIQYEEGTYSGEGDDFKGWKIKTSGASIKLLVENDADVTFGVGNLSSGAKVSYTKQDGTPSNNNALVAKTDNVYSVKGGTIVTFVTDGASTVTLKKIEVGAPAAKFDVTYKANGSDEEDVVRNVSRVDENMFTYAGHSFTGWNTQADGKGTAYAVGAAVTSELTLFAQWEEIINDYSFTPATSGDAPSDKDEINTSTGGSMTKVGGTITYDPLGLFFQANSSSVVNIELNNHRFKAGTIITGVLTNGGNISTGRGCKIKTKTGSDVDGAIWTWDPAGTNEEKTFSYTVQTGDGIIGTNSFRLGRVANFYLKSLTVTNAELVSVPVTIGAYGYASFASTSALDFTDSGITAYIATANEADNVTMTEIAKVPANTGVVLKGTKGTVNVPVLTGDADDTTDNLLKPGEKTVTGDEATAGTIYAFGRKGGQVGFVKAAAGFTITAGKAYLDLSGKGGAKDVEFLSFVFGDEEQGETDGIKAVTTAVENGVRYNLAGQKVGADYKGIVIVNGKKVIIK